MKIKEKELEKLIKENNIEVEILDSGIAEGTIETFVEKYITMRQIPLLADGRPISGYRSINEGRFRN